MGRPLLWDMCPGKIVSLNTCVEGIGPTEVQRKPLRLNIHILIIYVQRVICGRKYGRGKTVLVRKGF